MMLCFFHVNFEECQIGNLSKRSTVYIEPSIHQALKLKAASSHMSVSEIIDEAVRLLIAEDQEDLQAFVERKNEPEMSYEALINDLKAHGKIKKLYLKCQWL